MNIYVYRMFNQQKGWCSTHIIDIDECALSGSQCHSNATSNNTGASFQCICNIGFSGNGTMCTGTKILKIIKLLNVI